MFFRIKSLGERIVESLRQALGALAPSGPWAPKPVPVPVRPGSTPHPRRRMSLLLAVVALVAVVAGTTTRGSADDTLETPCAMCRLWNASMGGIPEDQITLEAYAVENGVVLRATAMADTVRGALWNMSTQRQQLLEELHRGEDVPLCPSCRANVQAFDDLRIDTVRLPDGVLLVYSSTQPDAVRRLHEMLAGQRVLL